MDGLTGLSELHLPGFRVGVVLLLGWLPNGYRAHPARGHTLSDPSAETCLAWETLPEAQTTANIALNLMRARKLLPRDKGVSSEKC